MPTTRISLIQRIGEGHFDAWRELDRIYRPLITNWLRRYQLPSEDIQDLTQDVMLVLVRQVAQFEHNGRLGAFRNWLRATTVNLARNHLRKKSALATGSSSLIQELEQLEHPGSSVARQFDCEHDCHVVRRLLERVSTQFTPQTLEIFRMHVIGGVSAQKTAARVGASVASVYTAKSRVLRWLREQAADWIDEVYSN